MAQYEQGPSFGDDYTADESQMMAEGDPSAPEGAAVNHPGSPHSQEYGQDEDEEEIDVEAGEEYEDEDEDDYLKGAEYEYEVGGLNCLWKPDRPSGLREFTGRCGNWLALNREQIASGITGKSSCCCLFKMFTGLKLEMFQLSSLARPITRKFHLIFLLALPCSFLRFPLFT